MVGFGSSLRMSRRRGWEDAYLDYQSLRLLLTQIEAVYEEEDWHRGGGGGGEQSGGEGGDFEFDHRMAGERNIGIGGASLSSQDTPRRPIHCVPRR